MSIYVHLVTWTDISQKWIEFPKSILAQRSLVDGQVTITLYTFYQLIEVSALLQAHIAGL